MDNTKVCYQLTDKTTEGAIEIESLGYFAPGVYSSELEPLLLAACKEWQIRVYHAEGIDQDRDSGIYDVDRETYYIALKPHNCILVDGAVVGFIDDAKKSYYIFDKVTQWFYDYGHADIVDRYTYCLIKK